MKSNPPQHSLCVAVIARNAAALMHETLESVGAIADEIIVLDTGSTDTTPESAALGGARVVRHAWDDNFSSARNALLTHVRSAWVLWLDAGETIEASDAALLQQFVREQAGDAQAYYLQVSTPAAPGQIGGEQVARLRLHPNRPGLIFHGRVRESISRSLAAFGIEAEHLPLAIHRGPREHESAVKTARAQRNLRLADLQITQRGPTADLLNCLGEACQALGDPERAQQHYQRALELAAAQSTEMLEAYYGLLTCAVGSTVIQEQTQLCLSALEQFPLDAQLLCALGGYLQSTDRVELAIRSFALASEHGQVNPLLWHLPEIREIAIGCHAQLLHLRGKLEAAAILLEQGLAKYPESIRLQMQRKKLLSGTQLSQPSNDSLRVDDQHALTPASNGPYAVISRPQMSQS